MLLKKKKIKIAGKLEEVRVEVYLLNRDIWFGFNCKLQAIVNLRGSET